MASDDDLRDKLTKALSEFEVFTDSDGHLSIRMKDPWTNKERVDALMPVVRAHSAEAWDDGYDLGQDDMLVSRDFSRDFSRDARRPNPWRGDDQ